MKIFKLLFILSICLSIFYTSKSQSILPDSLRQLLLPNYSQTFYKQLNKLRMMEKEYIGNERRYFESLAVLNSICGNYQETLQIWSKIDSKNNTEPLDTIQFSKYRPVSAKVLLDSIAQSNQIVILNEGHHVPQNRASSMSFLETFYKNGFRYIALETVKSSDTTLNQRKYPTIEKTGNYVIEPCYGDLVRQALKIGFTVIPYEYEKMAKKMVEREEGQADNIISNLFRSNPKAKLLMHVGYSHGIKLEPDPVMKIAMMGYFLKSKSGIEPFVIGQFNQMEKSNQSLESSEYIYATKKYSFKKPSFFVKEDGKLWSNNFFDASLFLPRSIYKNGRPDWLNWNGGKSEYFLDLKEVKTQFPFLIQAISNTELPDGVPTDQIEISDKNKALLLYSGNYTIRVLNKAGNMILEKKISIK